MLRNYFVPKNALICRNVYRVHYVILLSITVYEFTPFLTPSPSYQWTSRKTRLLPTSLQYLPWLHGSFKSWRNAELYTSNILVRVFPNRHIRQSRSSVHDLPHFCFWRVYYTPTVSTLNFWEMTKVPSKPLWG